MHTRSHGPVPLLRSPGPLSVVSPGAFPVSLRRGDPSSGATSHIKKIIQGGRKKQRSVRGQGVSHGHAKTINTKINTLPDNVLLEIFDLYIRSFRSDLLRMRWNFLVCVCQRWRQIILASPRRLDLQLFCLCAQNSLVSNNISVGPALPLVINFHTSSTGRTINGNVIAALDHPDRVCYLGLDVTRSQLETMAKAMQRPFPVLTRLYIFSIDGKAPVLPSGSLGGSAPRLQTIYLNGIPFPALPTLLSAASNLVELSLHRIPSTGYISPEAMAASLAALPRLKLFIIKFQPATSRPGLISLPPVTRAVLPALTSFQFNGASEYLEDLVSRIDGPQLNGVLVTYLNQLVDFQVAQLSNFIHRSVGPELTLLRHGKVSFFSGRVAFDMDRHANHPDWDWLPTRTVILCEGIDWQVSHMAQVLSHFSATLSNVVHLSLKSQPEKDRKLEGTDDVDWLNLLQQFPTVQTLHVSQNLAGLVALALEDITGGMAAEVLPFLDLIYLAGKPASSIEKFVALRQLSGRPVTVIDTEREFSEILGSYVSE